jgi:hypothetical protein
MDTEEIRNQLMGIVPHGLVKGLGNPVAGEVCAMAAVSLAACEPHSDQPSCVAEPDRAFAICINDARWAYNQERAAWMLPLILAAVGTAGTDRTMWAKALKEGSIRLVLPATLRKAAKHHPDPYYQTALERAATWCAAEGTTGAAKRAHTIALGAETTIALSPEWYAMGIYRVFSKAAHATYMLSYESPSESGFALISRERASCSAFAAADSWEHKLGIRAALDAYASEGRDFRYLLPKED